MEGSSSSAECSLADGTGDETHCPNLDWRRDDLRSPYRRDNIRSFSSSPLWKFLDGAETYDTTILHTLWNYITKV